MAEIEMMNKFLVGSNGKMIVIQNLSPRISREDALLLAAWLVVIAEDNEGEFDKVRKAVESM